MDTNNFDTSVEKPSFFKIFKARCSESDLGPISFNWFEELSSEAPPYDFKRSEDPEFKTNCLDQSTFKTPKGKLFTSSQLASTPIIFKERNKSLPFFASPVKEAGQSKAEAGRSANRSHRMKTILDHSIKVMSPPNTCLLASPAVLRETYRTPQSNKCTLSRSLLCTPKLFEAQTQKCISESLGAEVDPEMSWSSSLATPPTLSPTVIIARGSESVSATKQNNERLALIMHSLFSKYGRSPRKNSVQSVSGIEDLCTDIDSKSHNFGRLLEGSFGISRLSSKLGENQKLPDDPEDDDMDEADISVCLASGKAFLRKVRTVKWNKKKCFDKMKHNEMDEAVKVSNECSITDYEKEVNTSKCDLQKAIVPQNSVQKHSENQNGIHTEEEITSSLISPWSQLDLSGLEITQLEKVSSCQSGLSSSLDVNKCSQDRLPSNDKVSAATTTLEPCILKTSSLIKVHKLLNISSPEKLPAPEISPAPIAIVRQESLTLVKSGEDEQASVVNMSESDSFLMENTNYTEFSECQSSCFHIYSRENGKTSSGLAASNTSTRSASGGELTGLKTSSSLSNLKRRPKQFIYTVNTTPVYREEGTTQRDGSSACPAPMHTNLNFCVSQVSKAAVGNEGQTEETSGINKHAVEEIQKKEPEKSCAFPNMSHDTPYNKKSSIKSNFTDKSSVFLQTDSKKEMVLPPNLIAANLRKEPSEHKFHAITSKDTSDRVSGGKCANLIHFSSLQETIPEESTLTMQRLKMGNEQAALDLICASGAQVAELEYLSNKTPKPTIDDLSKVLILEKNVDLRQPPPLDLKNNAEDNQQRGLGCASDSKTQSFGGFKTASNKQIPLSDCNVRKGKLLFKDIQDQFLEDFPSDGMQNISNTDAQENAEFSSVVRNNLNKDSSSFSHVSDSRMNLIEYSDTQSIFPEYANLSFRNVLQNQQPEGKPNLTASQEAEVTELSNILEETGSQFEFTQCKKQGTVLCNSTWKVCGSIEDNEIGKLAMNSEVLNGNDSNGNFKTNIQRSYDLSPSKDIDTTEESKMERQSNEEASPSNSPTRKWNKAHFVPNVSSHLPFRLSSLGDCSSTVNKGMDSPGEISHKTPELVGDLYGVVEMFNPHKTDIHSVCSNRSNNCWNNHKYMKQKGTDWQSQWVKEVNAEYTTKNNTKDTVTFVKEGMQNKSSPISYNESNIIHISSTTEVNLKIIQKYSVDVTGNQLSSVENNRSILVSRHFVNCGETQCNYNLQETLSDLTCLAEVAKTEKKVTLNNVNGKENLNSNHEEERINNPESDNVLQSFHTVVDGNISAQKTKTLHLLAGSHVGEDLDNISLFSSEKADIDSKKGTITSVRKSIGLNKNETFFGTNHQEVLNIGKEKQNSSMGFHTASGKQITITDKSLAKATRLLSEEIFSPEKDNALNNLAKPCIQASVKGKKNEEITTVREALGEGTEKHCKELLNLQSYFEVPLNQLPNIVQTENPENIKELSLEINASESDLLFHIGRGEKYTINEACTSSKNDISKTECIAADVEKHLKEEGSGIYAKQDLQHLSYRNTSNTPHDACNEKNFFSGNFTDISQETSSKRSSTEKNFRQSEETSKNESCAMQKCNLKLLDANTLQKNSAGEVAASTSKLSKAAFNTASGKIVGVSQDALKKAKQLLREDCYKSVVQDIESHFDESKHDVLESHSDALDNEECTISANTNFLTVEKTAVENSIVPQLSKAKEYYCGDEQIIQNTGFISLYPESNSQILCLQMNYNTQTSNKLNCTKLDFSTDNCSFFSTASGKPVQLSKESLKKARVILSEIENNDSSAHQRSISDCSYSCDKVSSVRNKATPKKRLTNMEIHSNIPCGFSTASGKQVQISKKSLQKVMGLFKECDEDDLSSNSFSVNQESLRQDHILPIKPCATFEDNVASNFKPQEKCDALHLTTNNPNEKRTSNNLVSIKMPMCMSHTEEIKQPAETNQMSRIDTTCDTITKGNLDFHCPAYSQTPENYLEIETSESAKAFMEDDDLTDSEVQAKKPKSHLVSGKTNNYLSSTKTGKRHMEEENTLGEPPIKRKLLPEFDRLENSNKSLCKVSKSSPEGVLNDRRNFTYNFPLKPVICGPISSAKEREEVLNPNLTTPDQECKGSKYNCFQQHISKQSSNGTSAFLSPFNKPLTEENKKVENPIAKRPARVFVPPFKTKSSVSEDEVGNVKEHDLLGRKNIDRKEEINSEMVHEGTIQPESNIFEKNNAARVSAVNSECRDTNSDLTKAIANLQYARNLQEVRLAKKQRQRIRPQSGSLYLEKISAACRIPLKVAVGKKPPGSYVNEQLYTLGVSKQCININSINAEDFQFLIPDFFSKEYFFERHGIQLADGGYLIPTDEGKAGKEEFYKALCDTPGVDPKLISKAWVYNHYRWIIWKLAAMEVAFPQEFANRCLTPERVLLQLKYRYDVEVDKSHRSAIKRITERDDVAAKTLVLCISKTISLSANISQISGNKNAVVESKKEVAVVEVTDGWYGIKAVLDSPLQSLLCREKLTVGQKIVVHGAELVGPQDASAPLEAPDSLMLKISANSTRRARWYAKLGYHQDPRPFSLPLSSLFSDGGTVGCIDIIIQRVYPTQWMEKISTGSYVFRNCRAEEREASKHAESRQKTLEALLAKIQAEFEKNEGEGRRALRSRTLTRQQIRSLQDGAELYKAILDAADPAYMEGCFSEEQLKVLNSHRQMVNDKKQAQIEAEFRKAVESAEQEEHSSCKRDVTPVMKLRIVDYRKEEKGKEVMLSIWRPSSDVCALLREGGRFRVFQLAASQYKGKLEAASLQLTATKKTQYLQLPVVQDILSRVYRPRQSLQFKKLLEPSFQPTCSEVDLVGYVVSLRKGTGFSTLLYLSDENHNLITVQICTDLKQLAVEDILVPSMLISASNLQWRPEFRSAIPTLFAGDLSTFSSNPKESHLQGVFNELREAIESDSSFDRYVQHKLMSLLQTEGLKGFNLPKEHGLDPFPSPWKCDAGNNHSIATPSSELRHQSHLTLGKLDSLGSAKMTKELQETPKNYKKRKAMDLLSQVLSPPPVKPICTFVSPSLKRAFQPPRRSGPQCERSLERTACKSLKKPALKRVNKTDLLLGNNFVADEELAMINTQALLSNIPEERKVDSTDYSTYSLPSDQPDNHILK
ncbi:breast cancer type 2 susceptibility protein isoform X2 [Hemicordylus capensis]|nr:breast cancer type 2 susceptibility protein isoform X2 [Hemicordylus capensis]XP_053166649.1 breast cancer type 2 susceptibility protein isoform X2 [Hemicordylus capensis]XP_053166650.1 breast cancer type 2 susceptibility protein isoform X2 [Hemicordylus capensis]XP_053166651.1 breast cancer type 2 susceptibility protein isoform X2 [Hemicordylus capensis]